MYSVNQYYTRCMQCIISFKDIVKIQVITIVVHTLKLEEVINVIMIYKIFHEL